MRVVTVLAVLAAILVTGCGMAVTPVMPPTGLLWNEQKAPMFTGAATGSKTGMAKASAVLGIAGWGDCSIDTAAKAGGITQIRHVDYEYKNMLGVYQEFTTIVKGE